jgi:PPOX class probable F420-dependent enzyme
MSLKPETIAMMKAKNFATLTTLRSDGHPTTQVMWVDCDQNFVLMNTEIHRRKFHNMQRDPRVTVTVWRLEVPYEYIEIRGLVHDFIRGRPARAHIDQLALRYFGRLYDPDEIESERVIVRIRPLSARV